MSIALTGFLTGFAKGAKERIEKEREENEALIESRLKMAATNRLKREKERDAQKMLLNQRYDLVSGYLPPDATEEQKLALISNETIAKEFAAMRTKGEDVDLNKFLVVNKDKIPQGFTSVRQYIDTLSAAPTALSQEQMQQAFGETKGFLGARTGVSAGRAEKIARQFGAPAAELLAYEQTQELPQMPEIARMNVEMLKEEQAKTPEQRIQIRQNAFIDAVEKFGADSPEAETARQAAVDLAARVKALNPTQEKFADMLDKAKVKAATTTPGTPAHKAAMAEVDRLVAIGKKEEAGGDKLPTIPQMRGLFSDTVSRAVQSKFGSLVGKDIAIETSLDGTSTYKYIGTDPNVRQQIREVELKALASQFRTMSDGAGRPLNMDVRRALLAYGVEFDKNGVPVFGGATPQPQPVPPAVPVSPVGASRVTPGAAQPAPVTPQAAPTRRSPVDEAAINWARTTLNNPRSTPLSKKQAQDILKANGLQ